MLKLKEKKIKNEMEKQIIYLILMIIHWLEKDYEVLYHLVIMLMEKTYLLVGVFHVFLANSNQEGERRLGDIIPPILLFEFFLSFDQATLANKLWDDCVYLYGVYNYYCCYEYESFKYEDGYNDDGDVVDRNDPKLGGNCYLLDESAVKEFDDLIIQSYVYSEQIVSSSIISFIIYSAFFFPSSDVVICTFDFAFIKPIDGKRDDENADDQLNGFDQLKGFDQLNGFDQ
ncbi:MAG: hypothetical protein EZS28_043258 [Streblomastix strix]|uniref:Uncharacterized protein n=1 Tax=Streblomastix strix TaxID=222440 RepID=A0A5J4TUY2_9EUKA|nr:MAG: hypothetical protein EZS28_043258 [Streblomastix strix]